MDFSEHLKASPTGLPLGEQRQTSKVPQRPRSPVLPVPEVVGQGGGRRQVRGRAVRAGGRGVGAGGRGVGQSGGGACPSFFFVPVVAAGAQGLNVAVGLCVERDPRTGSGFRTGVHCLILESLGSVTSHEKSLMSHIPNVFRTI